MEVAHTPTGKMSQRACDACKARKIKCDGALTSQPCSNCRMSQKQCQYLVPSKKRGRKSAAAQGNSSEDSWPETMVDTCSIPKSSLQMAQSAHIERVAILSTSPNRPGEMAIDPTITFPKTPTSFSGLAEVALPYRAQTIHQDLTLALGQYASALPLEGVVTCCIDLYMRELFAIAPIVSENFLRSHLPLSELLTSQSATRQLSTDTATGVYDSTLETSKAKAYAMITAVCASAAFLLPAEIVSDTSRVSASFLRVSQEMLKLYQDVDITRPDSSSLVVRMMHAGALHTNGKSLAAWQPFGEALRLAEHMRLYDEHSFEKLDMVESKLRRLAFWQLYIMDSYAGELERRPAILPRFRLLALLTTKAQDDFATGLMMQSNESPAPEGRIIEGFLVLQKLWSTASELLLDLQIVSRLSERMPQISTQEHAENMNVTEGYLRFVAVMDELPPPPRLQQEHTRIHGSPATSPSSYIWTQRTNFLVTYHCLKMTLLQYFVDLGLANLIGTNNGGTMLAFRKLEIAQDFVTIITDVPFEALRVNGESCVTKIRRIGAVLLEVIHRGDSQQVVSRAKSLSTKLLDVLARLDSRASDELNNEYVDQ